MDDKIKPGKKILFVITQSELGGAQRFLLYFIGALDLQKYHIRVVVGRDGDGKLQQFLKRRGVETTTLNSLRRGINFWWDLRAFFDLKKIIKGFRPNTLFLNSSKAGIIGSLSAATFNNLRVVYRIGGWSFNDPGPALIKWFYKMAEKFTARFKDIIIVNNRHDFEQAKTMKMRPKESIKLIHNGIDPYRLDFFSKDEARIKLFEKLPFKNAGFLKAKIVLGTIANFYKTKGLTLLIEGAQRLAVNYGASPVFVIIGDGPERSNLEAEIKNRGLENQVFLPGRLDDAFKYLPAFDIFVLPSVKEGFPWAVLEAMSAKVPVVATDVGAVPEIIEDGKNGILVRAGSPEQLAAAIKKLAEDERLRTELGIQGHQTVLHKFDLNKMTSQVEFLL